MPIPLDVKKMPLGKLSKQQIARGFEVLEALEEVLTSSPGSSSLEKLSSQFYTVIPHNFGRNRPPSINSQELLQAKKDMLLVRPQGPQRQAQGTMAQRARSMCYSEHPLQGAGEGRLGRCRGVGGMQGLATLPVTWESHGGRSGTQAAISP